MTNLLKLFVFLLHSKVVLATNFWAIDDPGNPDNTLGCNGKVLKDTDFVVAHKTLPCGTKVLLFNPRTNKVVIATKLDAGPKHADIDLAPAVTKALRANGAETLLMVVLK